MGRNILTAKEARLNSLIGESENAVDLITAMIQRLEAVNSKIASEREEIERYRSELEVIDGSMGSRFDHNAKVIEKFKSFLEW